LLIGETCNSYCWANCLNWSYYSLKKDVGFIVMIYNEKLTSKWAFYAFPLPQSFKLHLRLCCCPYCCEKNVDKSCGRIAIAEATKSNCSCKPQFKTMPPHTPGNTNRHFLVFSTVLIWEAKFMQDNIDIK